MAAYNYRQQISDPDLAALKAAAVIRLQEIEAYLAIADTATAAQVRAEVKNLDQAQRAIIKALIKVILRYRR